MKRSFFFLSVFFVLMSNTVFAEEEIKPIKKTDFYLLGSFGIGMGDTNTVSNDSKESLTTYSVGITAGYQISRLFAVEVGYSTTLLEKENSEYANIYPYKHTLHQDDYKANFLVQYHLGYRFLGFIPYAGAGIMLSYKNYDFATARLPGVKNEFDFGVSFKAGVRAKLAIVMVGAFVEYNLRFTTTKNLVGGLELGLAY